jgi:L-amino acid N-acyltransferase YncA
MVDAPTTSAPWTLPIRSATTADARAIAAIYNDAVATTVATMDTEPRSEEDQLRWLADHQPPYVVLIAMLKEEVVGWASISRWSDRRAYATTGEVSVYVDRPRRGEGIGRALMARLVEEADRAGFHSLLARIADGNAVSLHLHDSLGFRNIGAMREVGWKFGRWVDVYLLERLNPGTKPVPERPAGPGSAMGNPPRQS